MEVWIKHFSTALRHIHVYENVMLIRGHIQFRPYNLNPFLMPLLKPKVLLAQILR